MGYVILEFMRTMAQYLPPEDELVIYSRTAVSPQYKGARAENRLLPRGWLKKLWYFYTLRERFDAVVFMAPMLPLILPRRIKPVMLCQELASQKIIPDSSEALFAFVRDQVLMRISIRRAVCVVVPSQATKDDIVAFYGTRPEKIVVIPDGYQDLKPYAPGEPLEMELKPFFFFTGKVKYRKNVHGIVSAFIAFKKRVRSDCKLLIGGSYGGEYYEKMLDEARAAGLERDIVFLGYVSIQKLYWLYSQAMALVFPSFNEGFGMPIIEAMSLGLPVITSNISSMAEVAADAGLLVNPADTEEISRAMERLYCDPKLREELIGKGYRRATQFSWERSGKELLELVRSL